MVRAAAWFDFADLFDLLVWFYFKDIEYFLF